VRKAQLPLQNMQLKAAAPENPAVFGLGAISRKPQGPGLGHLIVRCIIDDSLRAIG